MPDPAVELRALLSEVKREKAELAALRGGLSGPRPTDLAPGADRARFRPLPGEWDIALNKDGSVSACLQNVVTVLTKDPEWADVLAYDEFRAAIVFTSTPPWFNDDKPPAQRLHEPLEDEDYTRIALWVSRAYRLKAPTKLVAEAVSVVARRASYHPVREYLEGLTHDPKYTGLDNWLSVYLGAEDTPYTRDVGRWWLISAVARVFEPGCKADVVLILEGPQGRGKSTALRALAGAWFSDTPIDLGSKDSFVSLRGRWLVELAELDSLNRSEANRAKAFFSSPVDVYRPPYGRESREFPRQCVFAGSTNQSNYLRDDTGGRRYWPVKVGKIDLEALRRDRAKLWAAAVATYRAPGVRWYPASDDEIRRCVEQQGARFQEDPWEDRVSNYLEGRMREADGEGRGDVLWASIDEILEFAIKLEISKAGQAEKNRIVSILKRRLWEPCGQRTRVIADERRRYRAYAPTKAAWEELAHAPL